MAAGDHGASQGVSVDRQDLGDGSSILTMPYDESLVRKAKTDELENRTTPDARQDGEYRSEAGPIMRFNDVFTDVGSTHLEALGLDGFEVAKSIQKRRDEIFRNVFPLLSPRFEEKCRECDAEYDRDVGGECPVCGGSTRPPDEAEKLDARRFFQRVNREGQSLRELYETCEDDHGRIGVGMHVIQYEYVVASGDATALGGPLFDRGEVIRKKPDELIRADPKRVVPVTDEDGRIGGWKWACPIHRDDDRGRVKQSEWEDGRRTCGICGSELREVHYAEKAHVRSSTVDKLFLEDEVIDWAYYFPRQHGLDGLSPVHHVWMKQAILHWMDVYAGAFYDPSSDRYPNKFMVVHTTNADAWERNFEESEDEAEENLYANSIFVNEYAADSKSTPELQVVELMDDELLGQNESIKKQYKSDIRTQFGVTDVFDSELDDAGGLNNEGLQLEVTDRAIASAQRDLAAGPLDELMKRLGFHDYEIRFVPQQDDAPEELEQKISAGESAAGAGLDAEFRDGEVDVKDGEFEADEGGEGGLADMFADFKARDYEGGDPYGVDVHEVTDPDDGTLLGVAVDMPEAGVYVDWKRDAFDDPLDEPHVSDYGTIGDLRDATDNEVTRVSGTDLEQKASDFSEPPDDAVALDDAYKAIVWGDAAEQAAGKAEPFWEREVPERVLERVREAIRNGAVFDEIEAIPESARERLEDWLEERLSERESWSIRRLRDSFSEEFGVPESDAEPVIRTEMASVLGNAREDAYDDMPGDDEPVFRWIGPRDHRETDACAWMKEVTDDGAGPMIANYGEPDSVDAPYGEPVTMGELVALEREAQSKFFPQLDEFRRHVIHPNERHTFTESFKADVAGAAGPIEVEYETMPGTFEAVP